MKLRENVRARQRRPARTDQTPENPPHIPLNANDFLNYWCGQLFLVVPASCSESPTEYRRRFLKPAGARQSA